MAWFGVWHCWHGIWHLFVLTGSTLHYPFYVV